MTVARRSLVVLAAAVALSGGRASLGTAEDPKDKADPKDKRVCVKRSEINTIRTLDDRHALVKASAGRHYMFTLDKSCQDFRLARKVAISEDTGRVCSDGVNLLTYELPGMGAMRCRIDGIDLVEGEDAARELIRSRE
jgi:hypothetical protein